MMKNLTVTSIHCILKYKINLKRITLVQFTIGSFGFITYNKEELPYLGPLPIIFYTTTVNVVREGIATMAQKRIIESFQGLLYRL